MNIHRNIRNKYILISHNSDRNITEKDKAYIDDKIIFWFAQNLKYQSKKEIIGSIPIGLENLRYQLNGVLNDFQSN
jgi:lysyl-tRNA synthetase class II